MIAFVLSVAAALAALIGGMAALRSRKRIHLALGFTAGLILGLVAFDLLPEIFEISHERNLEPMWPMIGLVVGFLTFHIIEKFILIHHSQEGQYSSHQHPSVGVASALAFAGHSFLDGVSIGLAFQVNNSIGIAVAIAVIGHRFADGFNTTNVMLYHQNSVKRAKTMLLIAATMPIVGALSTLMFSLPLQSLAIYLGFFAGFLLYIGAADILPQAHSKSLSRFTIGFTVMGVLFMFAVTRLA